MSAFWDDVDDKQMTHSAEDKVYDHTTKAEREEWLRNPTMAFDVDPISRLCADVDRLEAERGCPTCAHCQLKRGGHLV